MKITESSKGLIGEYICASAILNLNWRVSLAQQDSVDLIAWNKDEYLRVQVKSSTLRVADDRINPFYHFSNGSGRAKEIKGIESYDILVHVGIDHRRCIFLATEQVQKLTHRYTKEYFEKNNIECFSFEKALQIVRQRRL